MGASRAFSIWLGSATTALDRLDAAHAAVSAVTRGRRYTTQQINQAYAVLLSAHFQRFCRDLHSEAVDILAAAIANPAIRTIFRTQLTRDRHLDRGNPGPGNLGTDFGRFEMDLWDSLYARDRRNRRRNRILELLNDWRNAIAHQDFRPRGPRTRSDLRIAEVRTWRVACNSLARQIDLAVRGRLRTILGADPW